MVSHIAGRGGDHVDMAAHDLGDGFRRTLECNRFQVACIDADALGEQAGGDMVVAAQSGGESDGHRLRVFFQLGDQVLAGLER